MKLNNICYRNKALGLLGLALLGTLTACEEEFWETEQYRKEIYIVSGDNNIFGQEYTFDEGGSIGYLSVYAGGVTGIETDVDVLLEHDPEVLREYNSRVHVEDYDNYAYELPADRYSIENMTVTLKQGADVPYSLCPIHVNIEGMNPDEEYFIPLRIASVSNYMVSESKRDVLFQVFMKNDYATTASSTYYNMTGTLQSPGSLTAIAVSATKLVVPVSRYGIRILPSSNTTTDGRELRKQGIVVTVHPDEMVDINVLNDEGLPSGEYKQCCKVTLESWIKEDASISVQESSSSFGDVSNYDPETKTFTLYYRYKLPEDSDYTTMTETMSLLNANIE